MNGKFRLPRFVGGTQSEQLTQTKNYLYQLVEQLNVAFSELNTPAGNGRAAGVAASAAATEKEAQNNFNSIKSLIIKSADIVNAYYEQINKRLEGIYVAEAEFPEGSAAFIEKTTQDILANSEAIEQHFSNMQKILSDVESISGELISVKAHIKCGLLYYDEEGVPIYGLEIGQRSEVNGEEIFNKYARFTSEKLSFYDSNNNEVAYISDRKLYITQVEVTGSFRMGGFVDEVLSDGGIVTKWAKAEV